MRLKEIYKTAIEMGIEADFRGKEEIGQLLKRTRNKYEKTEEKADFDLEKLENPFSDTRILYGDPEKEINKIVVGIDIEGAEVLLARELGADLVFSHHPEGRALAGLDEVMDLQIDVLAQYGVPINIAEKFLRKRMSEVSRGISAVNHNRIVDLSKTVRMPLMCCHTPCDNLVARFVEKKVLDARPDFLGDILKVLKEIPEYHEAEKNGAGPKIFVGDPESRAGKVVFTEITGGTEGAPEIYEKLGQAGAGTIIGMHLSEKHREEAEKAGVNVVIAGHISSDSLGVNLFLDVLEKQGIVIIPLGGLIRVSRLERLI